MNKKNKSGLTKIKPHLLLNQTNRLKIQKNKIKACRKILKFYMNKNQKKMNPCQTIKSPANKCQKNRRKTLNRPKFVRQMKRTTKSNG